MSVQGLLLWAQAELAVQHTRLALWLRVLLGRFRWPGLGSIETLHFEPDGKPYAEGREQEEENEGMDDLPPLPPDLRDPPLASFA